MKTSYYANLKNIDMQNHVPVSISVDSGKLASFKGKTFKGLSPAPFLKKWKQIEANIEANFKNGQFNDETFKVLKGLNQKKYVEAFYNKVLKKLDPKTVYNSLGENAVLVCYEKPNDFCHRFLVAGWLELNLGVKIEETGFESNNEVETNKENLKSQLKVLMEKEKGKQR